MPLEAGSCALHHLGSLKATFGLTLAGVDTLSGDPALRRTEEEASRDFFCSVVFLAPPLLAVVLSFCD